MSTYELSLAMQTPGLLARWYSGGAWRMASHLAYVDREVIKTLHGDGPRIVVIEMPPRHGKSVYVSQYLPAWAILRWPEERCAVVSYSSDYATVWGRRTREVVQGIGRKMGVQLSRASASASEWETTAGGGFVATGIGGGLTGRGFNLLILDDVVKNDEEALSQRVRERHWDWWQSTASTRLEPGGVVIVMMTRWHDDDLVGKLVKQAESEEGQPIKRLRLPAICEEEGCPIGRKVGDALWPARWPIESMQQRERELDQFWWSALYQQRPSRSGKMEWPDSYFDRNRIWAERMPDRFDSLVIACDPSKGRDSRRGDFSAIVTVGLAGGKLWVDADVRRMPVTDVARAVVMMAQRYPAQAVGVEANGFQELLAPEIQRAEVELGCPPLPLHTITNTVNKDVRISRLGSALAQDRFRFVAGSGTRLIVEQLREWPHGQHDDGPDALEMGVRLLGHLGADVRVGVDLVEA